MKSTSPDYHRALHESKPQQSKVLVLVSFSNSSDRDKAIKACSRHRAADFANVMVCEDRTPAQQAAFIKQRQEIRKLNDELEAYKLLEQYRNVLHKSRNTNRVTYTKLSSRTPRKSLDYDEYAEFPELRLISSLPVEAS
ncbi:hypothetical protein BpHYR1_007193 [Brachionus plicatilis]|uniref:Uncharacterized protein n=1 Tax=Brachionus plicatilis TaxID=10195 RepID=A0A3M7QXQ7_BRAPC|nr:hypothetical protein BpHYR1_007193 [Brachionus plicatilis]